MRNIDPARKLLYVLTPVPLETLQRVNTLLKGILEIPAALMLSVSTDYDLPFLLVEKKNIATSAVFVLFLCFLFPFAFAFVCLFVCLFLFLSRLYFAPIFCYPALTFGADFRLGQILHVNSLTLSAGNARKNRVSAKKSPQETEFYLVLLFSRVFIWRRFIFPALRFFAG